jgi:hypothetical protein
MSTVKFIAVLKTKFKTNLKRCRITKKRTEEGAIKETNRKRDGRITLITYIEGAVIYFSP